ncbi:MAG: response regulator [Candidatus Sumerlaeota bacterium]
MKKRIISTGIRLPACDEEPGEDRIFKVPLESEEPPDYPDGLVLLVDDEYLVREVGKGMLERIGLNAITATDGRDGVEKFWEFQDRFLFVILDMTMPRMDGEEVLREIRSLRPEVPILISSGYTEQEILGRFSDEKISGFVAKPYTLENIEGNVKRVMQELQAAHSD